jgi:hypothetical protein
VRALTAFCHPALLSVILSASEGLRIRSFCHTELPV